MTDGPAGLSQDFTVTNPAPLLESLEPTAVGAGNPDMLLTLQGSQFVEESVVQWNGEDRLTLFIGPDLVQAQIAAADLEEAGSAQIQVVNGPPGGGTSQELSFSITALVQTATVRLLDLDQSFNGAPRAVRVVTAPQRLAVAVTYNGLADPPTRPGSYAVQATITEPGFSGSVSGVLRIAAPPAPTARLVASRTEGPPPLEVTFSDDSQGFISTWFLETRDDEKRIFTNRSEGGGRSIHNRVPTRPCSRSRGPAARRRPA